MYGSYMGTVIESDVAGVEINSMESYSPVPKYD